MPLITSSPPSDWLDLETMRYAQKAQANSILNSTPQSYYDLLILLKTGMTFNNPLQAAMIVHSNTAGVDPIKSSERKVSIEEAHQTPPSPMPPTNSHMFNRLLKKIK